MAHNSKTIAFRVMSLVLQLRLVMVSMYSMFGADTFWVMGSTKVLHEADYNNKDNLGITKAGPILRYR